MMLQYSVMLFLVSYIFPLHKSVKYQHKISTVVEILQDYLKEFNLMIRKDNERFTFVRSDALKPRIVLAVKSPMMKFMKTRTTRSKARNPRFFFKTFTIFVRSSKL